MSRVAIYARFSTSIQRSESIEDQARLCAERASREGWSIAQTYSDMAISGAGMQRPGFQSLLAAAERGEFDIVLAEALDRLSRDQADIATLFKQLNFRGISLVTLAEGEISELHVGLKGTMNQLFLKDLAAKTHRGLRGRVEEGRSGGGNAYGYDVVKRIGADGEPVRGERTINPVEAKTVRRIFDEFAAGKSPKAIARDLNADSIPGPRRKLWRDTAIRGHRQRGTGILNNEIYIGRLVWNRLRYVKDPATGKRVSRQNPSEAWVISEVPDLRIIDDALWQRVKTRQEAIDATPAVQGIKASRFWEKRRKVHLLTGLLFCDRCGGPMVTVGKDYLACSAARKLDACAHRKSYRRGDLEDAVLALLQDRLMEPDAVASFIKAFTNATNATRGTAEAARKQLEQEHAAVAGKLNGIYDAIADGLRTPGLLARIEEMEARQRDLAEQLAAPPPDPVRLHPNLSDLYRRKVAELAQRLTDPAIRTEALEIVRGLISRVTVRTEPAGSTTLVLDGALTAMIDAAQPGASDRIDAGSVKVVAGVGFESTTFRLCA